MLKAIGQPQGGKFQALGEAAPIGDQGAAGKLADKFLQLFRRHIRPDIGCVQTVLPQQRSFFRIVKMAIITQIIQPTVALHIERREQCLLVALRIKLGHLAAHGFDTGYFIVEFGIKRVVQIKHNHAFIGANRRVHSRTNTFAS